MRKILLTLLTILVFGFAATPLSAQNTLTVADGTETNSYVPVYGYWADAYLRSQFIYPDSMLGDMLNYAISEMTFYLTGSPSLTATFEVKIATTTSATLSDFLSESTTTVYTGTLPITNNELTIEFDNPFTYTGDNLLVEFVTVSTGNYSSTSFYGISSTGSSVQGYSYSGVSSVTATQRDFLPKVTFSYGTPSLCSKPMNVTVTNITTTGATVSWVGSDNATAYNVQYMPAAESDWDNAQSLVAYDTTIDLTSLQPSSGYKVRVQTVCSDNTETNWSSVKSFMTACGAISAIPYYTGFESYIPVQDGASSNFVNYVECWSRLASAPDKMVYHMSGTTYSHASSQGCLDFNWVNEGGWTIAVMPAFDESIAINNLMLEFWLDKTGNSGTFEVGVMTDPSDASTFETVETVNSTLVGNSAAYYELQVVYLSSYTGSGHNIAFRVSNANSCGYRFDDLTVSELPNCTSPVKTSVTATGIDGHNATISFVDNDESHDSWTLYYKMNTETENDWQAVTLTDTFYTLTGLVPETTYNVYVVTNCGGVPSDDATLTYNFTTSVACPAPTAVTASPVYINDATITWTSTATTFNVEYGETGFSQGSGTTATVYENTITLDNLTAQTSYTVYVQADCGSEDGTSQWASVQFTTLPSCPNPTQFAATNVTSSTVDLVWTAGYQESEWEVRYGHENFNPDTSTTSAMVNGTAMYQMQNLNSNQRYDAYVRAICDAGDTSAWSSRITFVTQCEAAQLPLTENFDSYGDWSAPDCWQKFEAPNSGYVANGVYIYNETAYSGSKSLKIITGSATSNYAFIRLPNLNVDDISTLQVKLMAQKSSGSRPLIVGVAPEFASIDSIHVLGTFENLSSDYTEVIVSLADYPGTTGYIVIGAPTGYSSSASYHIDDVTVEVRPTCMYPTNFAATEVGETSVSLSWTELGTSENWNVEYGPMGFAQGNGTTVPVSDSSSVTIDNLDASTAYDFYVQSDCGGYGSNWVGPLTVVTSQYIMGTSGSDTITTCGMAIYDAGGPNGNHGTYGSFTLVVNPATEGSGLQFSGSGSLGSGSSITFYDGVGTSGTQIASYSGSFNASVAAGGPVTIVFSTSYYNGAGFELIAQCTDCFPPTNVTLSDITMTGATASWSGSASEYAVYAISANDTAYATTSDTSYTFTTLTSSSTYRVYVRSLCGSDSSLLSAPVAFNTACDQITVTADQPWFENFEGYAGGGERPFVCWETPVTTPGGGPFVYCGYAQSAHSGANTAELKGNTNLLVLPDFSNDIHELRLSFWATYYGSGTSAEIGVVTDILDPNSFELLSNAGTPGPRGNQEGVSGNGNFMGPFDFNGIQATSGRIAIRFTGSGTGSGWNLDDFTVSLAPNCPSPVKTSVTASNIDGHNATISFTDNDPDHNSWTVYYKAASEETWSQVSTNTTSADLTGLAPETSYDVYVVTNCATPDDVEDATLTISFTTTVACPAPTNLNVTAGMTEAIVTWNGTADSYTVTCGDFTTTVTENTATITGLTSGVSYTVTVTADCGVDGTSLPASTNFNTANCEIADQCAYTFLLTDSYGDGWNGGTLAVQQNGITVTTLAATNYGYISGGATDTVLVNLCDNISTSLVWTAGSYASEASFAVIGPDGTEVYASPTMDSYSTYTFTTSCSGSGPVITDPTVATNAATAVAQTTATLNGTITNPSNVTITAQGFEWKATTGGTYTQIAGTVSGNNLTANLSDLTANTSYTFKAFITFNGTTVYGNEMTFTTLSQGEPTAPTVATSAATAVAQTTATLNGTVTNPDNVTISAKGFQWKQASAANYTDVTISGAALTYNLTGLTAATDYTYRAFITFNGQTVYGDAVNFTTLPEEVQPCEAPTGLTVASIENHAVTVTWDANSNVNSWNIRYRKANEGSWNSASSSTNSYTISDLDGDTDYEIQVQADCGDGNQSDWTTSATAHTTNVGISSWMENSVKVFPNPANDFVNVQCTMYNVQMSADLHVFDVYGKLVQTVPMTGETTSINVSDLADGMYFVRVTTEAGAVTKTFVVKR